MDSHNKELSIAESSLSLQSFERRLGICNSALQLSSNEAVGFLERHPRFALEMVAAFYPLDNDFLKRNWGEKINQSLLFKNEHIKWNVDLIESIGEHLFSWRAFGNSFCGRAAPAGDWGFSFIKRFSKHLNWNAICSNPYISWDEAMVDFFSDKICWEGLSSNPHLLLSDGFLKKYHDKLDWSELSQNAPLNEYHIYTYADKIDWNRLCWNESYSWTLDFIQENQDRLNWDNLSSNQSLPWSYSFFSNYIDKFNFKYLSSIKKLPWSSNFIETYLEKWNWHQDESLTTNSGLPWSEQLVMKYWSRWDIQSLCIGYNGMTVWNTKLIDKVLLQSNNFWSDLTWNNFLPWSLEMLLYYNKYWEDPPVNRGFYEKVFASHITPDFINRLLKVE